MAGGGGVYRWRCSCCGEEQTGLPMDLSLAPPSHPEAAIARLDDDFCELRYPDGQVERFIRCLLPLPVDYAGGEFRFGVWMSVSEKSRDIYAQGFATGGYAASRCFGYLMNEIPGFEGSVGLHADVLFQPAGLRPRVILQPSDHPLVRAQEVGLDLSSIERLASSGHRPPAN